MTRFALSISLVSLLACSFADPPIVGEGATSPAAGPSADGPSATGPLPDGGRIPERRADGGGAPPPACTHDAPLATALVVTSIDVSAGGPQGGPVILAARPGGAAAAWSSASGKIHVTPLDAQTQRAGADVEIDGDTPFGLVATSNDYALLVTRRPDYQTFVKVSASGAPLATTNLVGGGNHDTVGVEWFGDFARTGRLVATPTGYAAYTGLHRRWPDGVGHQGDTLRMLSASGTETGGGWGWGCSHSLDQRLVSNGSDLAAVCLADCYPSKGIQFNWQGGLLSDEPTGNCAGDSNAELGGLVAAPAGGFWLTYVSGEGRATPDIGLEHLSKDGTILDKKFLTGDAAKESNVHLAVLDGSRMLLAYESNGKTFVQRLDGAGALLGTPEALSARLDPASDFVTLPNGDVAWAWMEQKTLKIARVRACV